MLLKDKHCPRCNQAKPVAQFNRRSRSKDGLQAYCRECDHATSKAQRKTEVGKEYARNWCKSSVGAESRRRRLETDSGRAKHSKQAKSHRTSNPQKAAARLAVRNAVDAGDLIRPLQCRRCAESPAPRRDGRSRIQAHHSDYSKPLQVEWLCPNCHEIADKEVA